jgi:hypothetical protein
VLSLVVLGELTTLPTVVEVDFVQEAKVSVLLNEVSEVQEGTHGFVVLAVVGIPTLPSD